MSATALKSINRRFSSLNYKNFEFFCLVPRSPTHTGLICEKKPWSQISQAWAPLTLLHVPPLKSKTVSKEAGIEPELVASRLAVLYRISPEWKTCAPTWRWRRPHIPSSAAGRWALSLWSQCRPPPTPGTAAQEVNIHSSIDRKGCTLAAWL